MKTSKKQKDFQNGISNWFLILITSISLYFNSRIQDPFNSPKMWLLLLVGSLIIGTVLLSNRFYLDNKNFKIIYIVNILFVGSLIISTLLSSDKYVAFFGETQRRTGLLSYLSMSLVMMYTIRYTNFVKLKFILIWMAFVGLISAIYGQLQHSGLDFVQWNNPYNSIIGTLGNPNFAAAFMAIMGVISLGVFFLTSIKFIYRILFLMNSLLILYTIYLSNARQGLISFAIGAIAVFIVVAYQKNKILGRAIFAVSSISGILTIFGMLQIGPLASLMYKSSVSIRGFYWRAGIEMFKSHPLFGVGVDRYGSYFKQYREVNYSLNYGFDITSTNAHNVPIQLFATGGIFVGTAYLVLVGSIFYFGVKAIKSSEKENKIIVSIVFAAWLSFQAQSIIHRKGFTLQLLL
jgi:O-antigen ligase